MLLPGRDATELEGEAAVAARLADRRRLDGVDRDSLRPAGVEDERGFTDFADGVDPEARLVGEPAADTLRRVQLEAGHLVLRRRGRRPLAEDVEQAEGEERDEEPESHSPHQHVALPFSVARDAQDDLVGHVRHG